MTTVLRPTRQIAPFMSAIGLAFLLLATCLQSGVGSFGTVTAASANTTTREEGIIIQDGNSVTGVVPYHLSKPLEGDVLTSTTYANVPTGYSPGSSGGHSGGVMVGDYLWFSPRDANMVVRLHKTTGEMTGFDDWPAGVTFAGDRFWNIGVDLERGVLWMSPKQASHVISVDLATGAMGYLPNWPTGYTGGDYRSSGALLNDRNFWMAPYDANMVVQINVDTEVATGHNTWPSGFALNRAGASGGFTGAVDGGSHYGWLVPFGATHVVRLDMWDGSMVGYNSWPSGYSVSNYRFGGGTYDGQLVWLPPEGSNMIVSINTEDGAGTMLGYNSWPTGFTRGSFAFQTASFDGKYVWFLPRTANMILRLEASSGAIKAFDPPSGWAGCRMSVLDFSTSSLWTAPNTGSFFYRLTIRPTETESETTTVTVTAPGTASSSPTVTPSRTVSVTTPPTATRSESATFSPAATPSNALTQSKADTRSLSKSAVKTSRSQSQSQSHGTTATTISFPLPTFAPAVRTRTASLVPAWPTAATLPVSRTATPLAPLATIVTLSQVPILPPHVVLTLQSGAPTEVEPTTVIPVIVSLSATNGQAVVGLTVECSPVATGLSAIVTFNESRFSNYTCTSAYPGIRCEIPGVEPSGVELGLTASFPSYYKGNLTVECTATADNTLPKSMSASLVLQQENVSDTGSNSSVGSATVTSNNRNLFGAIFLQCSDPLLFTTLGTVLCLLGALLITLVWRRHSAGTARKRKNNHLPGAPPPPSLWRSLLLHHRYLQLFLPCKVECVLSHSFLICSHIMCLLFLAAAVTAAGFYSPAVSDAYQWGAAVAALLVLIATVQPLSSWFYWKTADNFVHQESLKYLSSSEVLSLSKGKSTTSGSALRANATSVEGIAHQPTMNEGTPAELEDDMVYLSAKPEAEESSGKKQQLASLAMYSSKTATTANPALQQSMAALDDVQLDDEGCTTTFGSSNTLHSSSEGVGTLTFGSTSGGLGGGTTTDSHTATGASELTGTTGGSQQPAEALNTLDNLRASVPLATARGTVSVGTGKAPIIDKSQTEAKLQEDEDKEGAPHASDVAGRTRSGVLPTSKGGCGSDGGEIVCVGIHIELAEAKLLTKYKRIGHITNGVMVVLAAIGTYAIISSFGSGGLSRCDFFVFSLWKAILLDIFCAQPAVAVAVLGYRWLVADGGSGCEDIRNSEGGEEREEESRVALVLHP